MRTSQKNWTVAALFLSMLLLPGCALFLVGAGAAGGYAISKDTIEGHTEKPLDRVYQASREVLMEDGFIKKEDRGGGKIEGEVNKSVVDIRLKQVTERTVRIRVRVRKAYKLLPDAGLANELYNKLIKKL